MTYQTIPCLSKATHEQLWDIVSHDIDCPAHLMSGVVNELIDRDGFNHLIKHLINKIFNRWSPIRQKQYYDLFQIGYIGILNAIRNYQPGKGSFKTFAYMNIKSELLHLVNKEGSEKRKVYNDIVSLDVEKHDDNDSSFLDSLIDPYSVIEPQVMRKMEWEYYMDQLTDREQEIVELFVAGYSFNEIADQGLVEGIGSASGLTRHFHRAVNKINPNAGKINFKELGFFTMRKHNKTFNGRKVTA